MTSNDITISTPGFDITIKYFGDEAYLPYITAAADSWAEAITGDLPDVVSPSGNVIDDLVIIASVGRIDGRGGTLGFAGPTLLRNEADGGLPYLGRMKFDVSDVNRMIANGSFESVVEHEMGHVLGLGTLWESAGLISDTNPYAYIGPNALAAYNTLTGTTNTFVPLEDNGGQGTAGAHWEEDIFDTEMMTGYAENNPQMPMSTITIGALQDLGYQVNYGAADYFSV